MKKEQVHPKRNKGSTKAVVAAWGKTSDEDSEDEAGDEQALMAMAESDNEHEVSVLHLKDKIKFLSKERLSELFLYFSDESEIINNEKEDLSRDCVILKVKCKNLESRAYESDSKNAELKKQVLELDTSVLEIRFENLKLKLGTENKLTCLSMLDNDPLLWHKRLGHASLNQLNILVSKDLVTGLPNIKFKEDKVCEACARGKQEDFGIDDNELEMEDEIPLTPSSVGAASRGGGRVASSRPPVALTSNRRKRSKVWKFFEEIEGTDRVKCKLCNDTFKHKTGGQLGGTVTLSRHMRIEHPIEWGSDGDGNQSTLNPTTGGLVKYDKMKDREELAKMIALGKFDLRSDEGVFLGYSSHSKAYKLSNKRTLCVEESVHVVFDETNILSGRQEHEDEAIGLVKDLTEVSTQVKVAPKEGIGDGTGSSIQGNLTWGTDQRGIETNPLKEHVHYLVPQQQNMEETSSRNQLVVKTHKPDIVFSVGLCARFQDNPKESHLTAAKMILRYLKGTTDLCLWYPKGSNFNLVGYVDAYYAGFLQLVDFGIEVDCIPIFFDNSSAISMTKNPVHHKRNKHIDVRQHFLRDNYEKGLISIEFCATDKQIVDIFTKALSIENFERNMLELGMIKIT
ncbi:uncharacterized protein [Nicotiana sylvestris]|uniref:uncharacterized protein n=1 Tax=Nicotiana sylvestris TaxID=4096 RepID=UPI00388C76F7